jgi:zinc/manganese transport system substrate-binding protein
MKKIICLLSVFLMPWMAQAKLQIATTTMDLAALVKVVAQDRVEVFSIGKGTQDAHQIEAKPSFMIKLRDSDLVISQGLELESAWLEPLVQGSRNAKIVAKGQVLELGPQLDPLEIPKGNISRAEGDVHPGGNPHFQLDPIRLGKASQLIAEKLAQLDPSQKDFYNKNAAAFSLEMQERTKKWSERLKKTGVREVVTYHKSLAYFCSRFQIQCDTQLEPKPGIPPTTSHLLAVIGRIKSQNLKIVLIENYFDDSVSDKLKQQVPNLFTVRVPISVGGEPDIKTNAELIEKIVSMIEQGSK